jgi:branched-chain amino acid transport system substrate-binding protein
MKKWMIGAVVSFVVTFLAGCGGNSSTAGGGGNSDPIPIGMWGTITGPDSNVNGMTIGIKDYLEWVNEKKGGVNGHPFKVTLLDGKYDLNEEIKNFKRLVNVEKAVVVGAWSTGSTKALREEINNVVKVPVITSSLTKDVIDPKQYPYIFSLGPSYEDQHKIAMKYAKEHGAKTFAFIHNDKEYGTASVNNVIKEKFAESLGLQVVANVSYPINTTDVTAQLIELKSKNPDFIYIQDSVNNIVTILRDAAKVGIPAEKFFGNFFSVSQIIPDTLGQSAEGFRGIQVFSDFNDTNKTIQEIKEFQKTHKISTEDQYYVKGWVTGMLIEEAAKRVLSKTNNQLPETEKFRSMMRDELEAITNFDVGGAVKEVNYNDHKGVTLAKIVQIKNGKYEPVSDWISLQ